MPPRSGEPESYLGAPLVTNLPLPHAHAVTTPPPIDRPEAALVPANAPAAFDGAWLGRCAIGALEAPPEAGPGWAHLHPDEQGWCTAHGERRVREFVAGRAALRAALRRAGWTGGDALLPSEQGRPGVPDGWTGSITHKDGLALAIARRCHDARTLGVDSEVLGPRERLAIERKVLTPAERARWTAEGGTWAALLRTFSLKEAIYKALHPHVPRYIGFEEAEIDPDSRITMTLAEGEGPFTLVGWTWWEGAPGPHRRLVSICEARPG